MDHLVKVFGLRGLYNPGLDKQILLHKIVNIFLSIIFSICIDRLIVTVVFSTHSIYFC